jgi:signal transduction histidine kinase
MTMGRAQAGARITRTETADTLFRGPGELRARCRELDWGATALGPVADWSMALRTVVRMLMASRTPMFLWWGPERVQLYNDACRPSFGEQGRHPAALGMRGEECWPEAWHALGPLIDGVLTRGDAVWFEDEYRPVERNGHLEDAWWTYGCSPVFDDDGAIGGTLIVGQETTVRMLEERQHLQLIAETARAEAALRESDARYRALFDAIDAGFCVIEMIFDAGGKPVDYRFLETNPAFVEQSGLVNAVGRCVKELVPALEEHWFETYARVATTGEPLRFENGSDEMGRWFDVFAFRIGAPAEQRVALLFTDVTAERRAAQERERLVSALELERSRLAEVFRRAPSFVVAFRGEEQRYEFVNEAYYQLVGHREIVGKPLHEALPELQGQGFRDLLETVRQTGEPWVGRETPVVLQRTPGAPLETRYLDMVFQALVEADGTRSGVLAHGSDVTEQVLARREVERLLAESETARGDAEQARRDAEAARLQAETARRDAESANKAKSEFLAVMSHELRTPLNAIGGYASLIEMGIRGPITPEQRSDLARIKQSQRHLLGLINQVLNYTRVESGIVHYDLADVPVQDSLTAAEALIMPQLHAAGLSYTVRDCNPSLRVRADAEKVQQILLNVITNAIKFTKAGGEVRVGCLAQGDRVAISVSDTGVGIAPDKLASVFEPFVQVQTGYTRNNDGVGLGLSISRDLARGMGGDLSAESTPGSGSTFTLTLPASQ